MSKGEMEIILSEIRDYVYFRGKRDKYDDDVWIGIVNIDDVEKVLCKHIQTN